MRNCAFDVLPGRAVALWTLVPLLSTYLAPVDAATVRREGQELSSRALRRPPGSEALILDSGGTSLAVKSPAEVQACSPLINHGSYFSAQIKVGTHPGKEFDVVADTGSNSVIVQSCQCAISGTCHASDPCFKKEDSATLHVNETTDGKVPIVVMAFGSGQIEAEIGSDEVAIGALKADMKDQLLLMVDRALDLKGTFEGILGLGIPEATGTSWTGKHGVHKKDTQQKFATKSFLESASISRFSMCFQDSGNGTLRLNTPALTDPLGSVGVAHWGLDFRGISVGAASTPAKFCLATNMTAGQETPCGAIPDSGTTLIMGPKEQLVTLYEDICDSWPRCQAAVASGESTWAELSKAELLELVLANCSAWVNETTHGLDEMPELHFHIRGKSSTAGENGPETTLKFKGSDYVEMGVMDDAASAASFASRTTLSEEPVDRYLNRRAASFSGGQLVCLPAMGTMSYNTQVNGPVWILGTPLFYAFQVSYDLAATPPAIQLADASCDVCSGGSMAEVPGAAHGHAAAGVRRSRSPRRIRGPARGPSQPLEGPL